MLLWEGQDSNSIAELSFPKKCFSPSNWQNIHEEISKCYCCILINFKSEVGAVHWWIYEKETPRKGKWEPSALNHCSPWISLSEVWTANGMGVEAFPEQHYLVWLENWDFHGGVSSETPGSLFPSSLQWPGSTTEGLWVSLQIPCKIRESQEVWDGQTIHFPHNLYISDSMSMGFQELYRQNMGNDFLSCQFGWDF